MKQNQSVKELERGKDYINVHDNNVIVIDRTEDITSRGFEGGEYKNYLSCSNPSNWCEATEEEVIEAFKNHLVHRYGEDWETMKIKENHPSLSSFELNDGSWNVEISKEDGGWNVWNKNGLLYCNGIWVERLEEKKSTDWTPSPEDIEVMKVDKETDRYFQLKREVLTILSVESRLNPEKKISEYLEQFRIILEVL